MNMEIEEEEIENPEADLMCMELDEIIDSDEEILTPQAEVSKCIVL